MADVIGFPHGTRPGDLYPSDVEPPCEGNGHIVTTPTRDYVTRPPHYLQGGVEAIDIIEHVIAGYPNPSIGYLIGNALKYLIRAPFKNPTIAEDLKKAQWYINRACQKL